jgi:hypothetical protein
MARWLPFGSQLFAEKQVVEGPRLGALQVQRQQ